MVTCQDLGRPATLITVLLLQVALAGLMVFDWRLPIALVCGLAVVLVALRQPLVAVGLLIAGRLISTGSMSFLRIGKVNIGLFEPVLLLALIALAVHAATRKEKLLHDFPWRNPILIFLGWQLVGLLWCTAVGKGAQVGAYAPSSPICAPACGAFCSMALVATFGEKRSPATVPQHAQTRNKAVCMFFGFLVPWIGFY